MLARIQLTVLAAILVVGAFSTGADFLFFLLYLLLIVGGGAYVLTRLGLADLEAGYALSQLHGSVGERLSVTYTLRNASRIPKPWLEVDHPSSLPVPLPGRALTLGPRGERTWRVRVPLTRRGHFRVDPLQVRTSDPFGLFEASASVGTGTSILVYPPVVPLPFWQLPVTSLEGTHASRERTDQTTPLVTSVRPYVPGDSYNRIHWPTTARHQSLYVREMDLEQAADVWLFLDLDRAVQTGVGDESTIEATVRVAASVGAKALTENRAVGLTAAGHHPYVLQADRGARQHQKLMQLLAVAEGDGTTPLVELLIKSLGRVRRGMTVVVVTPSLDPVWVRPLAALRKRGIGAVVCHLDAPAYAALAEAKAREEAHHEGTGRWLAPHFDASAPAAPHHDDAGTGAGAGEGPGSVERQREDVARLEAVRFGVAEYNIPLHAIIPRARLGSLLVSGGATSLRRAG